MNVKKLILNAAPYGLVCKYKQKKHPQQKSFWEEYVQYLNAGDWCKFVDDSPIKTTVSLQGFGHTGSGAVVDLLREYENVVVIGVVDKEGSLSARDEQKYEVDFLRVAGGLFEIERHMNIHNGFLNDALLHRFMLMVQFSDFYRDVLEARKYFFEFFRQICTCYGDVPYHCTNPHLDYDGMNNVLFLNRMSVQKYRLLCRKLLFSLFNCYQVKPSSMLVLDQFVGDLEYDYKRYVDYIPNIKPILIYRDPRDVYVFAKEHNVGWIPTSSVEKYIDWYQRHTAHVNFAQLKGFYVTSFERLIKEYERVVAEIESFLSLDSKTHTRPLEHFDPKVSARGVGIWRQHPELAEDMGRISKQLSHLIYYK